MRSATIKVLQKLTSVDQFFPNYHAVADYDLPHIKHLYQTRTVAEFRSDLEYFQRNFRPITLADLNKSLQEHGMPPRNAMLLTVDDGFREVAEQMAPILREKGIPAVFMICPNFLDNKELFWRSKVSLIIEQIHRMTVPAERKALTELLKSKGHLSANGDIVASIRGIRFSDRAILDEIAAIVGLDFDAFLSEKKPFMSSEQIRQLMADGFEIGAHSINHPHYKHLDADARLHQTVTSVDFVQKSFNTSVRCIAHPFTDEFLPKEYFRSVFDEHGLDLAFGTSGGKQDFDARIIQRNGIEGNPGKPAEKIVLAFLQRLAARKLLGRNRLQRPEA